MSEDKDVYAIVYASGRAETVVGGGMGSGPLHDYWSVLDRIASVHSSSGFAHDYPKRLLRNGEPVEGSPTDLAWRYTETLRKGRDRALAEARQACAPEWMRSDA